ncbi:hypothetical protein [Agromyces sp. Marseille-Q5079]|uniref:hypothetical protein n=1 Tax=Agromyces sp. Marseille-Q5079 TaxID=3439059 RepID=UPI003D9C8C80
MPETLDHAPSAALATLPGAAVIRRIRRLVTWAIGTAIVYGTVSVASKGGCPGGIAADGGYLDANGRATDVVPQCVSMTMRPSGVVFLIIGVIVIWALTRVLRRASGTADAIRILDRATIAVVVIAAAWTVLAFVSFLSAPIDQWDGSEPFSSGFIFGSVEIVRTPMQP